MESVLVYVGMYTLNSTEGEPKKSVGNEGEDQYEFPIVAVNVDSDESPHFDVLFTQNEAGVTPTEEAIVKVRGWAIDFATFEDEDGNKELLGLQEHERVGSLVTDADGEYKSAGYGQRDW